MFIYMASDVIATEALGTLTTVLESLLDDLLFGNAVWDISVRFSAMNSGLVTVYSPEIICEIE